MRNTIIVLTSLVGFCAVVYGYPEGAGESACGFSLAPSHGVPVRTTEPPYSIDLEPKEGWKPGNPITVTIAGTERIEGFLLVPKNGTGKTDLLPGSFKHLSSDTQDGPCKTPDGVVASATHTSRSDKDRIVVEWTPADGHDGAVRFEACVLKTMTVFWIGITQSIHKEGTIVITTSTTTTTSKPTDTTIANTFRFKTKRRRRKKPSGSSQLKASIALFVTVVLAKCFVF